MRFIHLFNGGQVSNTEGQRDGADQAAAAVVKGSLQRGLARSVKVYETAAVQRDHIVHQRDGREGIGCVLRGHLFLPRHGNAGLLRPQVKMVAGIGEGGIRHAPKHDGAVQNRTGIVAAGADHAGVPARVEPAAGVADGLDGHKGLLLLGGGQRHDILAGAHGIARIQTAVHNEDLGIVAVVVEAQLKDELQAVAHAYGLRIILG